MSIVGRTSFFTIPPNYDLEQTAAGISRALAIMLQRDNSGKYEEYPAFAGKGCGLELVLLGIPSEEDNIQDNTNNNYELQATVLDSSTVGASTMDVERFIVSRLEAQDIFAALSGWGT